MTAVKPQEFDEDLLSHDEIIQLLNLALSKCSDDFLLSLLCELSRDLPEPEPKREPRHLNPYLTIVGH